MLNEKVNLEHNRWWLILCSPTKGAADLMSEKCGHHGVCHCSSMWCGGRREEGSVNPEAERRVGARCRDVLCLVITCGDLDWLQLDIRQILGGGIPHIPSVRCKVEQNGLGWER